MSSEGRAALEALRTSSIQANDLVGDLSQVAEECVSSKAVRIKTSVTGCIRELHPIAREEAYRIGYEAIRNSCMHSGASELRLNLAYIRHFELIISDNGCGIEPETIRVGKEKHYGLTGMRERARRIGGQLNVSSSSKGTEIALRVPGNVAFGPPDHGRWRLFLTLIRRSRVAFNDEVDPLPPEHRTYSHMVSGEETSESKT